jgi:mannosyltransferase
MLSSANQASSDRISGSRGQAIRLTSNKRLLWEIVAIGVVLRLIGLGHKSFWLDEIASVVIARMPEPGFWHWMWREEGNMSLYYVLLRPWLHLGTGEMSVRLLSVLPGIGSIPLLYLLGRRLFHSSTGMLAALFLALNTCAVVYSQEARAYSLLVLGTVASTYLFVKLIEDPRFDIAVFYALVAGATLYCHYFGIFVVLSHGVSLAFLPPQRRPWRQLAAAAVLLVILAFPVAWMIHIQDSGHLNWVARPSLLEVYHLGVFLAAESGKGVGAVLLLLDLVLVGLFFVSVRNIWALPEAGLDRWRYGLVACCAVVPVAASLLLSIVRPIFFHRFLIICLLAWILMTAVGAEQIRDHRRRMAAIVGVCLLSLVSTAISYTRVREDWRGVANYLIAQAASQDRVLYYEPIGYFATENYRDWLPGGNTSRPEGVMVNSPHNWTKKVESARRVWLVTYPAKQHDAAYDAIRIELQKHYAVARQQQFRSITITEYALTR